MAKADQKQTSRLEKYATIKIVKHLHRLGHLLPYLTFSVWISVAACSSSPGEERPLLNVIPDEINADHTAPINFVANYEVVIYQDVGCGGDQLYLDDSYDIYAKKSEWGSEWGNDTEAWFYLCSGTLDLDFRFVSCTLASEGAARLEGGATYDVRVEGGDNSRYTGLQALRVIQEPIPDTDSSTDSDTDGSTDSNSDTTMDSDTSKDTDGPNQIFASWTNTTPDFNGSLDILWNLEETVDNESGCVGATQPGTLMFDVLWNNEGLYVGVHVPDQIRTWTTTEDIRQYDCVTIFLDIPTLGGTLQGNDNWLAFGSGGARSLMKTDVSLMGAATNIVLNTSYELEMGISWDTLGITPSSGMSIGFDILVHDNDNLGDDCRLYWNADQTDAIDGNQYGRILLE